MSGSKCTICEHPQEAEIAREFLAGEHLRSLEQKYAVSKSALSRHFRDHTNSKALQKAATVQRPARKRRGEPVDVGDTLQRIAAMLQDVLDNNPGSAQATAQVTGALVRVLELVEKREVQSGKRSSEEGQEKLARVFESWSVPRLLLTLGRCPRSTPLLDACGQMLVCPTHGELAKEEMFAYVRVRAVSDYLESGGA